MQVSEKGGVICLVSFLRLSASSSDCLTRSPTLSTCASAHAVQTVGRCLQNRTMAAIMSSTRAARLAANLALIEVAQLAIARRIAALKAARAAAATAATAKAHGQQSLY